jgi:DNA helicase-2/ATP-dependent DNA helicase PcrA
VHLLNAHTGKGQQFDWVFVPGVEKGHIPDYRTTTTEELAEEKRVLLVMTSRVRQGLIITRSSTRTGRFGPTSQAPSQWWNQLAVAATTEMDHLKDRITKLYPLRDTA